MELQWPLILFTTFIAWACGVFGTQGVLALVKDGDGARGAARRSQLPALVVSLVLLAIGGIAVFFHLQHWERIFNGFGHLSSGITQELIAIVVFAAAVVLYFVMLRRSENVGTVPVWCAVVAVVVSVALAFVCGHSYMMASRPAWDSVLQALSVVGAACILGPATMALVMSVRGEDCRQLDTTLLAGVFAGAVLTVAYAAFLQTSGGSYTDFGYYLDPADLSAGMVDVAATVAATAPLVWGGAVVIGAVVPSICAAVLHLKGTSVLWKVLAVVIVVCGLVGAICLRCAFYQLGYSYVTIY